MKPADINTIKVLLADDHKIFREGIISLLTQNAEIEIIGEAKNGLEVLDILENKEVDVLLLDINMPKLSGLEVAEKVVNQFPSVKILVFSSYDDDRYILKMLDIGVLGYALKTTGSKELLNAVKTVASGSTYYDDSISKKIRHLLSKSEKKNDSLENPLTERELEILKLVADGMTNAQIGKKLFISPRTVDTHRRNILQKLNLHSAVELTKYAHEHKLLN